jgi:hypothetical protein
MRAGGTFPQLRRTAEARARDRERHVDLLRSVAVWPVVVGHWMAMAVVSDGAGLDGVNALGELAWSRPLTWLFQVMPVFFLVGGYANAASFARHRRAGGDGMGWVLGRFDRLLRPTVALLATLSLAVGAARLLGVDPDQAATAAWVATVPMWFLLVYLVVVAVGPWALMAHRRFGLAVPAALMAVVAAGDVARYGLGADVFAEVSYVAAWAAIHQLGAAWYDGRLPARPSVGVPLAGGAFAALLVLVALGPYPVSMVGVPGADQSSDPPTLALIAFALTQIGIALAVRDRATGWLASPRRWLVVTGVNEVVMTMFLWHMTAAVIAAVALHGTGILPVEPIGSTRWLVLRIPWILTCAGVLAGFVTAFARVELGVPGVRIGARVGHRAGSIALPVGVVATLAGMLGIALAGRGAHGTLGLPTWALVSIAAGVTLLAVLRQRAFVVPDG